MEKGVGEGIGVGVGARVGSRWGVVDGEAQAANTSARKQ